MKIYKILLLSIPLILLFGCSTPLHYYSAQPKPSQLLVSVASNPNISGIQEIDERAHIEVLFEPTASNQLFNGMSVFWIYFKNLSDEPVYFSSSDVKVFDKHNNSLELLTIGDVAKKMSKNMNGDKFLFFLASTFLSALEAAPYAYSPQYGTYSGYTSTGQYVQGTYQGYQRNDTVTYLAGQKNIERNNQFSSQVDQSIRNALWNLERLSLKGKELGKNEFLEGIICVPLLKFSQLPNEWRFMIQTTSGFHDFVYEIKKTSN